MSRSPEQGKDSGEKPFLKGILRREEKKWIFHVEGWGQQEGETPRVAGGPCNGRTRQWLKDWRVS